VGTLKQVIVIRKDLNMRKGKMVAQGAHASMSVIADLLESRSIPNDPDSDYPDEDGLFLSQDTRGYNLIREWLDGEFTKICVSVNSEQELINVYEAAKTAGLLCSLIKDAGHTEFKEPTLTCCAIGPAYSEEIDKITGGLSLL
jgi:PTH2 family peptidyl-tRNA hydrolase